MDFLSCDTSCQREVDDPGAKIMCSDEKLHLRFAGTVDSVPLSTMGKN